MSLLLDTPNHDERSFPEKGFSGEEISKRLKEMKDTLVPDRQGSLSLHCLADGEAFMPAFRQLGDEAFAVFKRFNAIFTGLEPAAAAIEDDVLDMCVDIFNGGSEGRCNITAGGTESIYCAMLAMREWAKENKPHISKPEFIAPYTAHAAFTRAAHNFGLTLRRIPVEDDWRVDPAKMADAINENTIGMIASAPNWPYGMFDPVEAIADIAQKHHLWCHVDACVGGYLAPFAKKAGYPIPNFDFTVPGVCSLSADLHKYGYVPKPCSTVLWRSEEEQQYHYFLAADWPNGPYLAQSLLGSRPFAPTAAAWAILNSLGEEGFVDLARQIMTSKEKLVEGIAQIDGLIPWDNDLSLLVVTSNTFDIQQVVGGMRARGWVLLGNEEPPAMHLTIDPLPQEGIDLFLNDLRAVIDLLQSGSDVDKAGLEYGMAKGKSMPKWIERAAVILQKRAEKAAANN